MRIKQMGEVGIDVKRDSRVCLSVSRRDMACAMSRYNTIVCAERFNFALRFNFFGFWFMNNSICES